jgi:hypothetical protein
MALEAQRVGVESARIALMAPQERPGTPPSAPMQADPAEEDDPAEQED